MSSWIIYLGLKPGLLFVCVCVCVCFHKPIYGYESDDTQHDSDDVVSVSV